MSRPSTFTVWYVVGWRGAPALTARAWLAEPEAEAEAEANAADAPSVASTASRIFFMTGPDR
jgi:hypothetical protein